MIYSVQKSNYSLFSNHSFASSTFLKVWKFTILLTSTVSKNLKSFDISLEIAKATRILNNSKACLEKYVPTECNFSVEGSFYILVASIRTVLQFSISLNFKTWLKSFIILSSLASPCTFTIMRLFFESYLIKSLSIVIYIPLKQNYSFLTGIDFGGFSTKYCSKLLMTYDIDLSYFLESFSRNAFISSVVLKFKGTDLMSLLIHTM